MLLSVQENEAVQEEKKKQLYEEGIDAILARAEVGPFRLIHICELKISILASMCLCVASLTFWFCRDYPRC